MGLESDTRTLHTALNRLEEALGWPEERLYARAESVSGWSPAQHVEHVLIALRRILAGAAELRAGEGEAIKPKGRLSLQGRALLLGGWIPRGKARAPDFAMPDAIPSRAAMRDSHAAACESFAELAPTARTLKEVIGVIDHPILGPMSAAQWWRFARVHTEHHLTIIDDVDRHRCAGEPLADPAAPIGDAT